MLIIVDFDKIADANVLPERRGPVYGVVWRVVVKFDRGIRGRLGGRAVRDDAPDKGTGLGAGQVWVGPGWAGEDTDGGVVHATVRLMALNVLISILDSGDTEDDDEWKYNKTWGDGGELWEELENGYEEEEARGCQKGGAGRRKRRTCWRCGGTVRGGFSGGK